MGEDRELLEAWREGDDEAGRRLVERHFATIERFFFNKVGELSADLIQLTFLRVLEARTRVRPDANLRAYLLGIARNVLYEHYRRVRKDLERIDFGSQSVAELVPTPSSQLAGEQEVQQLLRALKRIPLEHQIVLELYYWEGMTAAEVGEMLGVPLGTAKTRLRRAKQLLAAEISDLEAGVTGAEPTETRLDTWARGIRRQLHGG